MLALDSARNFVFLWMGLELCVLPWHPHHTKAPEPPDPELPGVPTQIQPLQQIRAQMCSSLLH